MTPLPHLQATQRRWVPPRRSGARLSVRLLGDEIGTIERRGPGRYRFAYAEPALAQGTDRTPALSASLPPREGWYAPAETAPFFEGLLPEGAVRTAIAKKFGLSEEDGFGLLAALGRECAGAVTIVPREEGDSPSVAPEARALSGEQLEALVSELPRRPLGVSPEPGGVRLSLGGVQSKLVLIGLPSGRYALPIGGEPSTCLIKPDFGDCEDLAANEAFCMRVTSAVGLETATTELLRVGPTPCLRVERFDRRTDPGGGIVRVHQEDMCQALAILPAAKYEADGGPSVAAIVAFFRELGTRRVARDINFFLKAVLVNFLLGNSDAHGKNFALLYDPDGVRLAPLYDIVSTAVYEDLAKPMAMSIGGTLEPDEVDLAAWDRLATEGAVGRQLTGFVRTWAEEVLAAAGQLRDLARAEGWHRPVIDAIVDTCRERAGRLLA